MGRPSGWSPEKTLTDLQAGFQGRNPVCVLLPEEGPGSVWTPRLEFTFAASILSSQS